MKFDIPKEVTELVATLEKAGHKAFIVGGSVRDLVLSESEGFVKEIKDWDITTDAKPQEIQKLFPDSVYENEFGTVGVKTRSDDPALAVIEVTTFRKEEKYSDHRHPDKIDFTDNIEEDLARRDFTINAIALKLIQKTRIDPNDPKDCELVDPFGGQKDLKAKLVRAVGDPKKRFEEDALRLMRAVRFAAELGFKIEEKTEKAVKASSKLLKAIANERIRDELVKIIMSDGAGPKWGIEKLEELGLLEHILPELREGIDVGQNKHHIYTVWEHNVLSLDYTAKQNYSLEVRMASLLHDVGKPRVKEGDGPDSTFYNHEVVGAKMARKILDRLHFSRKFVQDVSHLVRWHLFYYNVGEVTEAGVRRFLRRVGPDYIEDLMKVREADRIGSGVPKAVPYKLRHLKFMLEKVSKDPITHVMLKVRGDEVMKLLKLDPGPKIGRILGVLLEEVLDDPKRNTKKYLEGRVKELGKLSDRELEKRAKNAADKKEEFESGVEAEMKKKYYVK